MNTPYFYRFVAGSLTSLTCSEPWCDQVIKACKSEDSHDRQLADLGLVMTEHYGEQVETVNVWKHDVQGWVMEYWDIASHVMTVFIADPVSFLEFQARFIAPLAQKIIALETQEHLLAAANKSEVYVMAEGLAPSGVTAN